MQIKIKCEGSGFVQLSELKVLQGNLKDLSEENYKKLRKRIEVYGFDAPFFVCDGYILDGTQRKRVLDEMLKGNWTLKDGQVPIVEVQADNLKDAKQRLLGYVSQFGKLSDEGLHEFVAYLPEVDFETLDLPDFDMDGFLDGGGGAAEREEKVKPEIEFSEEILESRNYVVLVFDNEVDWMQAEELLELKSVKALDSKEGYKKIGIGRVLRGVDVINKIRGA